MPSKAGLVTCIYFEIFTLCAIISLGVASCTAKHIWLPLQAHVAALQTQDCGWPHPEVCG